MDRGALRNFLALAIGGVLVAVTLACGDAGEPASTESDQVNGEEIVPAKAPVVPIPPPANPRDVAVLTIEGLGEIRFELAPSLAPSSVTNFIKLAESDFYDGTQFHRVIPGFMVQGGDPNTKDADPLNDGRGGPGYTIPDEFSDVSFVRGIVSMARPAQPDSAGSQFFIVHEDSRHLDGNYTVIGQVTQGIDIVDKMTLVPIDHEGSQGPKSRPLENLVLNDVRIERGAGTPGPEAMPADDPEAPTSKDSQEWDQG